MTTTGINIGDHKSKANSYIRFTGKVVDKSLVCGKNQLVNWANSTVSGNVTKDDASLLVTKSCKDDPVDPTPGNGETPSTIVSTGAGTIASGVIGAGSVTTMLGYYIASRKKLM